MDGKIIYILIIIAYGIYSSYAKSKKEEEAKKKKVSTSTTPPPYASIPAPKEKPIAESWQELIRTITQETKKKKQVVVTQTAAQKSQASYNQKKKSVQERVFNQIPGNETGLDVMKGLPDEGPRVTSNMTVTPEEISEQKAYQIKEEDGAGYILNAREAIIQSVILTRPEY